MTIVILLIFVVMLAARETLDSVDGQTNSTTNQTTGTATPAATTSAQDEASQSIRGAMSETGEFLGNVTERVVTSKSAGTVVNETSDVLGNATVEIKRFFNPDNGSQ